MLSAIIVGGGAYIASHRSQSTSASSPASNSASSNNASSQPSGSTAPQTASAAASIRTIPTVKQNINLEINSISRTGTSLLINMSLVNNCSSCTETLYVAIFEEHLTPFADAYLIDQASNQKYGVIKDANGKAIASDDATGEYEPYKGKVPFYIEFTAPAAGAPFDLFLQGVAPITGLSSK